MNRRTLRQQCEARLRDLPLPQPFDVRSFCQAVADRRGRELHLRPVTIESGPYGVWVAGPTRDVIFYNRDTSPLHQDHIILHEACHIACRHQPIPLSDPQIVELLCPHLDPILIQQVLGRIRYSTDEEREAELLASLILERAAAGSPSRGMKPMGERDVVLDRLEMSLDVVTRKDQ